MRSDPSVRCPLAIPFHAGLAMMIKKVFSILLLSVLLFNLAGHRLLLSYLEDKADGQLEARIDGNDYDSSQLISIKIPVTYLPYYNNSSSFERIDGAVEIAGVHYKYVKRRILNDSLELLCIRNTAVTKLKEASNEFFMFVNDLQHTGGNKNPGAGHRQVISFSSDYYTINAVWRLPQVPRALPEFTAFYIASKSFPFHPSLERPPCDA